MITVPLSQGMVALIDDCDGHLAAHRWYAAKHRGTYYAKREARVGGVGRTVYLHREVLGLVDAKQLADHVNGDGLDCRRVNLRTASRAQNGWNRGKSAASTSGFRGVYWFGASWGARLIFKTRAVYLGSFASPEDAAAAFDIGARLLYGDFARTNFDADRPVDPMVRMKVAIRMARIARRLGVVKP